MSYSRTTWANGATALSAEHMNNIEDGINEALTAAQGNSDMWSYIRNLVYPVGSIYMTASLDTVAKVEAALGGTWVAWGSGKVPVGVDTSDTDFDTVEETGGVKTVTLTAAQSGIPAHAHGLNSHTHTLNSHTHGTGDSTNNGFVVSKAANKFYRNNVGSPSAAATATIWQGTMQSDNTPGMRSATAGPSNNTSGTATGDTANNTAANASSAHTNLQPYITCFMYKRTA